MIAGPPQPRQADLRDLGTAAGGRRGQAARRGAAGAGRAAPGEQHGQPGDGHGDDGGRGREQAPRCPAAGAHRNTATMAAEAATRLSPPITHGMPVAPSAASVLRLR